jgi:hypothetical protein
LLTNEPCRARHERAESDDQSNDDGEHLAMVTPLYVVCKDSDDM